MNAIIDFLKKLGAAKVAALGLVCIIILALMAWLIASSSKPPMSPLYSNLSPEDSSVIVAKLQLMDVQHTVSADSTQIMVPLDKIPMLRMNFAQEGVPSAANIVGYEIFDKSDSFGTSQFVYNVNLVRALEGELSRTISSISSIESARVHLVIPKKELFSRSAVTPSASIVLKIANNQQIGKNEIAAITHFVSSAIPELKTENITIIDSKGRPLKLSTEEGEEFGLLATGMLDFKSAVEARLARTIEDLLEKSIGIGKVKASVTADIDFDREVTNTESYDPDGQVVRSHKVSEEKESDTKQSDNVSVSTNLPYPAQPQPPASAKNRSKSDEITNYEISKKVSNKVSETGMIKSLSIAVLVDGTYTIDRSSGKPLSKYNPRSAEELEQIKTLIASAAGIDDKRGDKLNVVNMQFTTGIDEDIPEDSFLDLMRSDMKSIIQTIIIAIVFILSVILLVRPLIIRVLESRKVSGMDGNIQDFESMITGLEMSPQAAASTADLGGDIDDINLGLGTMDKKQTTDSQISRDSGDSSIDELLNSAMSGKQHNLIKYLNDTVSQHVDETVSVIRNWLYKGDE